jgi:hypothetical protein
MSRTTFRSQVRGKAPIFSPRLFPFPRWKGLGVRFLAPEAPEAKSTTLKDLRSKDALSAPSIKANLQVRSGRLLAATRIMYPMEATRMRSIKRMAIIPAVIATCGLVAGCFSYHKTVDETATTPAPVVETVPAPVAVVPAPAAVTAPVTSSSTTTTTTDTSPPVVERQKTTTYTTTPY